MAARRKALLEQLRSLRPPLPESDITREEKALDAAIAEIEGRYGSEEGAEPSASPWPRAASPNLSAGRKAGPRARPVAEGRPAARARSGPHFPALPRLRRCSVSRQALPASPPRARPLPDGVAKPIGPYTERGCPVRRPAATSPATQGSANRRGRHRRKRRPRRPASPPQSRRRPRLRRLDPAPVAMA